MSTAAGNFNYTPVTEYPQKTQYFEPISIRVSSGHRRSPSLLERSGMLQTGHTSKYDKH